MSKPNIIYRMFFPYVGENVLSFRANLELKILKKINELEAERSELHKRIRQIADEQSSLAKKLQKLRTQNENR